MDADQCHRDAGDLQAVQADVPLLIDTLAEALECGQRRAQNLHCNTWRIGKVSQEAGELTLYFHPRLTCEEDIHNFDLAMRREVRSQWRLIVTGFGTLSTSGATAVELEDLIELDPVTGKIRTIARPSDRVGMPRKNPGGRLSEYGTSLAKIISDRKESGVVLDGSNAECRAILSDFKALHPDRSLPSLETVKRHLAKSRNGS